MSENKELFGTIPMRTWRWLGVNGVYLPEEIQKQNEAWQQGQDVVPQDIAESAGTDRNLVWKRITVPAGKTLDATVVYRAEQQTYILANVGEGGILNLVCVQMLPLENAHAGKIEVFVEKDARVNFTAVELGASEALSQLTVTLQGDKSVADVAAIYFGDGSRKVDINYIIRQLGKSTKAEMQIRGALKDESEKIFRGTLDFVRGTKGSIGREREEVILLNEGVRNRSVPLMLSGEDDVDGIHGVSVGKMDKAKLFYLMSRGLDLTEAQQLVVEASFTPVLERITNPELKEEIELAIKERVSDER